MTTTSKSLSVVRSKRSSNGSSSSKKKKNDVVHENDNDNDDDYENENENENDTTLKEMEKDKNHQEQRVEEQLATPVAAASTKSSSKSSKTKHDRSSVSTAGKTSSKVTATRRSTPSTSTPTPTSGAATSNATSTATSTAIRSKSSSGGRTRSKTKKQPGTDDDNDDGDDDQTFRIGNTSPTITPSTATTKQSQTSISTSRTTTSSSSKKRTPTNRSEIKERTTTSTTIEKKKDQTRSTTTDGYGATDTNDVAMQDEEDDEGEETKRQGSTAPPTTTTTTKQNAVVPVVDVMVHRLRHFNYHPKPIISMASTTVYYTNSRNTIDNTIDNTTRSDNNENKGEDDEDDDDDDDDEYEDHHNTPNLATTSQWNRKDITNQQQQRPPDSYVAVSRENGTIELYTIHPKLRTIHTIAGSKNIPMNLLTWINLKTSTTATTTDEQKEPPLLLGVHRNTIYVMDFFFHPNHHQQQAQVQSQQQNESSSSSLLPLRSKHNQYSSAGGNIFSLIHLYNNVIAIGSQDGIIRILSIQRRQRHNSSLAEGYEFHVLSTIPTATGEAVLSLACCSFISSTNPPTMGGGNGGNTTTILLFAGIADGTIRRYDCSGVASSTSRKSTAAATTTKSILTWKSALRMTMECYGRSTPTLIWTMKTLTDGTVITGDSLGHVQFWDGTTGTLLCTFDQNDNKADVLTLVVTSDENKVFTSGVDSRVVCIERQQQVIGTDNRSSSKWIMTHAQRPHTHDVKAMTIVNKFKIAPTNGKVMKQTEILYTGGIDTKLCTYHVSEFGLRRPRSFYPWPSIRSPIVVANQAKIVTMLREDYVDIYELSNKAPSSPDQIVTPIVASDKQSLIGTIHVKGASNLSCSAISACGTFLALCDCYSVFLFHLQIADPSGSTGGKSKKVVTATNISIRLPGSVSISTVQFIQSSLLALATYDGTIYIYELVQKHNEDTTTYHASSQTILPPHQNDLVDQQSSSLFPIHSILCSFDGTWMTTIRNSCDHDDGAIDIYRKTNTADYQYWWTLPKLNAAVTAASLIESEDPNGVPMIAVACVNFTFYLFNLVERQLSDWSVQAGYPLAVHKIPNDVASRNDFPIRIGTNPANPSVLLIGSFGAIVIVNTAEKFPKVCRVFPETHVRGMKRKRSNSYTTQPTELNSTAQDSNNNDSSTTEVSSSSPSCTICLNYNSMLYMGFIDPFEMVVVEQPWLNVVATFPGALHRKVYGT